ncbi:MAG: DUF2203 domain-containing protein [Candidatus Limnocylindria bacterium]
MSEERADYTLDQARAMLPEIRATLLQLAVLRGRHAQAHAALHERLEQDGDPHASAEQHRQEETLASVREAIQSLVEYLETRGIELRDLEEGLVDIPTTRDGEPAWFCWRLSDPELAFWHTTHEGYASRKPL